jgi:hypothetical protein
MRVEILATAFAIVILTPLGAWAQPSLHPVTKATGTVTLIEDRHEHRKRCRHDRAEIERERSAERAERRAGHRHEAEEIHARIVEMRREYRRHCR